MEGKFIFFPFLEEKLAFVRRVRCYLHYIPGEVPSGGGAPLLGTVHLLLIYEKKSRRGTFRGKQGLFCFAWGVKTTFFSGLERDWARYSEGRL